MTANTPILKASFERSRCRHIANGQTLVLHCHHFATLTAQLANDCALLDAKTLLAQCAEDAFYPVLSNYYRQNTICDLKIRIGIAERYFAEAGLGKLRVTFAGTCVGEVALEHSHVDEGWIKKWGKSTQTVNHIGCGYVTALFSAVYDRPTRTYAAKERQSIACGANVSVITVTDALGLHKGGN
jgi:hypothetical protein